MDSSWLPDEERTCHSHTDENGRINNVSCNQLTASYAHNIPVKFWGSVNRNIETDWKCRREKSLLSDEFVCRAID
jgi:hypothetical protein